MSERKRELFDAVIQDPTDKGASAELVALLEGDEAWTDLVNVYVHLAEGATDPHVQSALLVKAADIAEGALGDAQRTLELLAAAVEGDEGGGRNVLARMRGLLVAHEAWGDLLQVGEAEAARIEPGAERAALLFELGDLLEHRGQEAEAAMRCYQAAFAEDPACIKALWAAARLYREAGNWEMVVRLLDLELQATAEPIRRAEVLADLANILLYELDQPDLARRCLTELVTLRPEDEAIRSTLNELGGPAEPSLAPTSLAPPAGEAVSFAPRSVPPAAVSVAPAAEAPASEPAAGVAADAASEPAAPVAAAASSAPPAAASEASEAPAEAAPEAATADATDPPTAEPASAPPAAAAVDAGELVTALLAQADAASGDARLGLLVEAALQLKAAGGGAPLADVYLAATRLEPADQTIYWKVGSGLKAPQGTLDAIASGLESLAASAEPEYAPSLEAHRLLFGASALGDDKGVDFKLRDLAKKSGDPAVDDWQIQRLIETDKWRNIQQIITQRLGGDPASARLGSLREMARLAEARTEDPAKAADFWRQVHMADKDDADARQALLRLYPMLEKWKEYADILTIEVDAIPDHDVDAKIDGLRKLVAVYSSDHLSADQKLVTLYQQLLDLDPHDETAMAVLVEKYEAMRKWPDLVKVLQMQSARASDAERVQVNLRIAALYLDKFRNQAEAITAYETVLSDDPDSREAIEALDGLYEKRRDWDNLVDMRRRAADLATEPADRLAAYKALADYATQKIRRPDLCLTLWEEVRAIEPADEDALRALVGAYEQDKRLEEMVAAAEELVGRVSDTAEQVDLLQKAGSVLQDRLGDKERAVGLWQRLLDIDPEHRRAGDSLKKALIDLADWDGLEGYFARTGKFEELVRILEGQVGVQTEDATRIDLLFRAARVWAEQVGQEDRAVRALERVLQIEPENQAGAAALEPIYTAHDDHRKLAGVLEVLLTHEDSRAVRRSHMSRLASLNEQHLRNIEGAFAWTRKVVEESPADVEGHAELERLGGVTRQWPQVHDDLVEALAQVGGGADVEDPAAAQRDLLLRLARILDQELGAYPDALGRYHEVLELEPDNTAALDAIEDLYTRTANWPELLVVLDRKLALATDPDTRKALLRKQGGIYEDQLEDPWSAVERHRAILEEDGGDREALSALARLFAEGQQFDDLHGVLVQELALVEGGAEGDATALRLNIGLIELGNLGRTAEAISRFEGILADQADNADAKAALESLLDDGEHRARVARILEPIHQDAEDFGALVGVLEIQLEETEEAEARVALLARIGTLHIERTGDIERAFDAFARLLREDTRNALALARLFELAEAGDRFEPLAGLIEEVLPTVTDETEARGLLARLAAVYDERLGDVAQAIDAHRRVLELDPENRPSIEALELLYQRSQQHTELLAVTRQKLELTTDPEARQALQFQIAELLENLLGEAGEAIVVYREILEAAPENAQALEALDRLLAQEELWTELVEILDRRLALAEDDATRIAFQVRVGLLHEQALGNLEQAIATHQTVLAADPQNAVSIEALERLVHEPEHRLAVALLLEPIYAAQDDWQRLAAVLEIQHDEAEGDAERVALLHRIAELYLDRGGDGATAFETYARAFRVDPSDAATLARLDTLADALDGWEALVGVYRGQVYEIADVATATAIHKRVAAVLVGRLADLEGGRSHYEAAYEADDTDLEVLDALEAIYSQTAQWTSLVGILGRKSELTEDPAAQKALFFRMSALYEELLGDSERAVETFLRVRAVDPDDAQALDALERIYTGLERWDELIEVLEKKVSLETDLDARKALQVRIGEIWEIALGDLTRAVEAHRVVLTWDDADAAALAALDRLYQLLESWEDLHGVLRRQVEVAADEQARLALRHRIARLHEEQLDDVGAALDGYAAILADAPQHMESIEALWGLVRADREATRAAGILEPVLIALGAWAEQVAVWRDLLAVTQEPEARTALLLRIGNAQEEMLADSDQAFVAYGEALREDPDHQPTLEALERVAGLADLWAPLVQLIEAELPNADGDAGMRALYLRVARIFEEELGDNAQAIERFQRVVEIDPEDAGALLALDRLFQKEARWAELAEVLHQQVERADDAGRVALQLRLGALYENNLESVIPAIEAYRGVLEASPGEAEAVASLERLFVEGHEQPVIGELLEPLYTERADWARLHDLLQALLAHQLPGEDRMRAMHRLAELSLEKLEDQGRGFDWFGAALREVPEDERSRAEVARLADATGRFPELVGVYTDAMQKTQDLELIRDLAHELATIYRERLDDDGAAEQMYRYVLDGIDDGDPRALAGLDALYENQGRWPELAEILEREVNATFDVEPRIGFLFRLGQVQEARLGDIEAAAHRYREVLDAEPLHVGALDRLELIYQAQQQAEPLYDIYARKTEIAETDEDRARLKAAMAHLAAGPLGRPEDATELFNEVLALRGENPEALQALEQLYLDSERWRELVDVCERQVNLVGNDQAREVALYARLGRVWGDHLDREQNALENWAKVLEREPEHLEALWAVRSLHERTGDHAALARADHRLLEVIEPGDAQRQDLFRQLGRLYQTSLEQPADAIVAWTQVLALSSHDPEAIEALEELYAGSEDWASCVEVLDRKVEITEDAYEQVSILFRIAEMYEQKLGDAAGAQGALVRVLGIQGDSVDAFEHLERLYETGEQWEELVSLLLSRLEQTEDAYARLEAFERIGKVFEERLGLADNAFLVLGQAIEESRDDERFGAQLERLAGVTEKWAELVALYENVLTALGNSPESVPLHLRVATWYDEKLSQPQHAGTHYQYVLAIEPDNVAALSALEQLLERYQNWPKVAEVLARKVELLIDPDERRASLTRLAGVYETKLDNPDAAILAYEQVVQIDGGDLAILQSLEGLYALRQRWQDLIEVLDRQAGVLTDEAAIVENHLRAGEMWETRLNAPDRAIEAYNQALAVDEQCVDAMQALEKLYTLQDRWHDLLDIYDMLLRVKTATADQLRVYGRIAHIQEKELRDLHATLDTYDKMARVAPEDAAAMAALDRLYRETSQWDELAAAYERHLMALVQPQAVIAVRTTLAALYQNELADIGRAIETLEPILDLDPHHRDTLALLGELHHQNEDWLRCIEALGRLAHLIQDRTTLLDTQCRIGRIYQEKVRDLDSAQQWFQSALEHDPNHLPALDALQGLYEARGEWMEVVRIRKMMEAASRAFADKSKHLFAIGRVYDQHLNDRVTAIDFYEQALDLFPENLDAAGPLVAVYWDDQRWERVEPLLTLIVEKRASELDLREQQNLHYQLAYAAERLHKEDKALTHYRHAYELDSTHLPTLQGMGELLYQREDWDRAFKIFQTILVHHREGLPPAAVVEVFFRQGGIKLKVGERRKAQDFFRKALDIDPRHVPTLEALTALHEAQGDWDDVIHYRRQLVGLITDDLQRFQALVSIGEILHQQMRNTRMAIEAWQEAMQVQPTSKLVLAKLLALHEESGNWEQAVAVLGQLADLEADPARQAKYFYAVGAIQRDYLKDPFTAVRTFDKALDSDPRMLKAFQAIVHVLTEQRDFERQDRYYRKMLKRATDHQLDDALVIKLAKDLGEINRTRLQKFDEAVKAYKIALAKKPDDLDTHQIVAQLYELENRTDKAIAQYYKLIELNPRSIDSYQQLRRLFHETQRYDEAWCVCQVLYYLGQASPDERAFFEKYRSRTLTQARRPLDRQHWALIVHPELSGHLGRLFQKLYRYTAPLSARTHKELGLHKRKDLIEPAEQTPFNNVLNYASQITRLARTEAYKGPATQTGIKLVNLNPPAMLVGGDVMSGRGLQELAFTCAKALFLTGEHYVMAGFDDTYEQRKATLMAMTYTITQVVMPQAEIPHVMQDLLPIYQAIPAADRVEITKTIQAMQANPAQHLNLSKWLEMIEHSANRLGFLLANDVGAAMNVIKNEPGTFSRAPSQDRIREIVLFALSENYFQLRKALGLNIG